ncbi:MAG: hypothetical protein C0467_29105 [Planctomycetaceae bacterium]|nr:hypothetical protein [Planctomycetaceae bacterium]
MPTPPTETVPTCERAPTVSPLVAAAFIAFAAANLFVVGWLFPSVVTRGESSAGFRAYVGEVFGNAPTAGRVFVGRAR